MLNKAKHKTRATSKKKAKHTSNATNIKEGAFFLTHLRGTFPLSEPLTGGEGEELKSFKLERNMRVLRRSPRGAEEDGN